MIMCLVHQGMLDLDEPVIAYLLLRDTKSAERMTRRVQSAEQAVIGL